MFIIMNCKKFVIRSDKRRARRDQVLWEWAIHSNLAWWYLCVCVVTMSSHEWLVQSVVRSVCEGDARSE